MLCLALNWFLFVALYFDMVGIYDYEKWYYIEFEGGHVFVCGKYVKRIYHKKTEAAGQPLSFAFFWKRGL